METLINVGVEVLRLVPLVLVFYVPALMGVAILKERGEAYRFKAVLLFAVCFGLVVAVQLVLRSVSPAQVAATLGLSAVQILAALALAYLTVYKLAD